MANRTIQISFLLVLASGALLLAFFILKPFLPPLALAAIFAVVLQPLYKRISTNMKGRTALAALLTVFVSIVGILVPLILLGTQIFNQAAQLYLTLSQGSGQNFIINIINDIGQKLNLFIPGAGNFFSNFSANLATYINQGLAWVVQHLGTALSGLSRILLDLFIFIISLYYLLQDGPRLKQAIIKLSPLKDEDDKIIFKKLESAVNSVVKGSLLIALLQGVLTAIGFTIFGVPNSILWGTVTVIAALIPGIGTALILMPAVVYLFIIGSTLPAIGLLVWAVGAVGLVDNFLSPKLVGRELELHPLLVLLSVLGGIALFGPVGLFLGPITISLLFAFLFIYSYLITPENPIKI